MKLVIHTHSDRGGRKYNEDALSVTHAAHGVLLALADGLGGHAGGAEAAQACVAAAATGFKEAVPGGNLLGRLVEAGDAAINAQRELLKLPEAAMRSTLALLWYNDTKAQWAHVGDSRAYWFRNGILQARTRDHSVAELALQLDPSAPPDPADQHRLVRALGAAKPVQVELGDGLNDVQPGDAFLLCSDGVWGIVTDAELSASLREAAGPEPWVAGILAQLQNRVAAQQLHGHDNFSMIAAMLTA